MGSADTAKAKVSAKGWIVIPAAMRHRHGLTPGTIVSIQDAGDQIVISAPCREGYKKARGMLPARPSLKSELLAERAQELKHEEARLRIG